ncbi:hypothetical protein [Kitasatospora sp. NPDC101183]|uniref:hypothetical protein n=1 Tax=Kitasatospora sp. NPDC101183 TaxID=3364100 RepID=UPI00381584FF
MSHESSARSPGWARAGGPLLVACLGWACAVPTVVADDRLRRVLSDCRPGPGAAPYVLPLAWAGLALGVVAVCWGGWQLATVLRRGALRFGAGHAVLLCVVLPVAVIGVPVQYALVGTASLDSGPHRQPCVGLGEPAEEQRA